ncbi:Acetate [Carpediemonas membranifera]|uniref:Acetate n=1 Tax=Carpediemonas membranifera TaxID=201153 RepID=A0A8J6AXT0_9EUKA|nr:Acetate [Carpediemonas membranifera]|eukprot:KAG9391038.1 Acetate [Carpediemonas membranifera]
MAPKLVSVDSAVKGIRSNTRVWLHGTSATPTPLVEAMVRRHESLSNVEVCHVHTEGSADYAKKEFSKSFKMNAEFVAHNVRNEVNQPHATMTPIMLHQIPKLIRSKDFPVDTTIIQCSPPDRHGFMSLGSNVIATKVAMDHSRQVIGMINPNFPRTFGDATVHMDEVDVLCEEAMPLHCNASRAGGEIEQTIGKNVASLIEDGSTLQIGFGGVPDAVMGFLTSHKDLGIHTEMLSEGVVDLMQKGVINNAKKAVMPNRMVASFALGSARLFETINDHPGLMMMNVDWTNDPRVIAQNPKVIAVNGAIEVDLTGQSVADSIGTRIHSGVGGQLDFMRGAAMSEGGKPIIALPSRTKKGAARIVPWIKQGAGVVTGRYDIDYVVTEYGIAKLWGKSLEERAKALIAIAHPDDRANLTAEARKRNLMP